MELYADTVSEAINGLCKVLKIQVNPITGRRPVKIVGFETAESLTQKNDVEDLHVVPAFFGAKQGVMQVIVGAVLVVVGVVLTYFGFGLGAPIMKMGVAMMLGGLVQMLFPVPTGKQFSYLGAPGNTTKIGTPIALVLGEAQVFGQVLSYNVDAVVP